MTRPAEGKWVAVAGLAALYYLAARLGLTLAFEGSNASPVWPPSGLAVAAVLWRGPVMLLGVALGAFTANAAVFASNGAGAGIIVGASLPITAGNCMEAWLGAWLLQRWVGKPNPFDRLGDVAKFFIVAPLASLTSATVGLATLLTAHIVPAAAATTVGLTWWVGDTAGMLVLAPMLITLMAGRPHRLTVRELLPAAGLLVGIVALGIAVFGFAPGEALADRRFVWFFMPCIAWAAYWHGPFGVAAASLATASLSVWGTTRGLGPFARGNLNDSLIVLQTFVSLTAITGFVLAADRRERQQLGHERTVRRDLAAPWAVLLGSLGVTVLGWHLIASDTERRAMDRFAFVTTEVRDRIANAIGASQQILRGAAGLFAASTEVDRSEWRSYVDTLRLPTNYPGIQAVGFARMVSAREKDALVREVRADGFADFAIKPEGERPSYAAVVYIEPFDARNQRAFGLDLSSEPVRRAGLEQARDTGLATVSGRVTLVQEDEREVQAGTLIYHPIYRNGTTAGNAEQRRENLVGFVYSPLRMANLVRSALGEAAEREGVAVRLYSGRWQQSPSALLFDSAPAATAASQRERFAASRLIELPGEPWTLMVSGLPRFEASIDLQKAQIVLVAGVGLSLLLFVLVRTLTLTRERALMLADDMNAAMKDSQAQFRSLAESASEAIVIADADGRVCSWNRAAQAIFGYTEAEMLGQGLTRLMPERFRELHQQGMARMKAGGPAHVVGRTVQLQGLRADGTVFPIELSLSTWESAAGRFYSGIIRDITDRERAAEALRHSERAAREAEGQLQAVLRASPLGIIFTDASGQLIYGNPTYLRIAGLDLEAARGEGWAGAIHPDDIAGVSAQWAQAVAGDGSFDARFRYLHADGAVLWARAISAAIVEGDHTTGYVAVVEDITGRMAADAELAAKTNALERSNEELAQYAYVASHDLKEPLRTVVSYSQLLLRRHRASLDDESREFVELIDMGARRAQALVSDLLALARVDSSAAPPVTVSMQRVLDDARLQLAAAMDEAGTALTQEPLPDVLGDRAQLAQLLQNLLGNAIKFRRTGESPTVHVAAVVQPDGMCRFSVSDNGIGIPPRYRDQIFTIFKRLHRHEFPGTGIGLAICKKVVERHGGRIWVEDTEGPGTTISFTIPSASPRPSI